MKGFLLLLGTLIAVTIAPSMSFAQKNASSSTGAEVEQIFIAHAVRRSRVAPTNYCNEGRIGVGKALFEDNFDLRSIKISESDGKVVSEGSVIGQMHVCFGATTDAAVITFHSEGILAKVPFIGKGECLTVKRNFPETGLTTMRCFLDLQGLPDVYIGGQLTSNTVLSRNVIGDVSDPPGYFQPSIITVRLWKRRVSK